MADCLCCVSPPADLVSLVRTLYPDGTALLCCSPCSADSGNMAQPFSRRGGHFADLMKGTRESSLERLSKPVTQLSEEAWGINGKGDARSAGGSRGRLCFETFGLDDKVFVLLAFGNVTAIDTDDGIIMIDTAMGLMAPVVYDTIREWSDKRVSHCIYTHGHLDHASWHASPFVREHKMRNFPRTTIVAHENVSKRFDRYKLTSGYNAYINKRQFQSEKGIGSSHGSDFCYPDITFRETMVLEVGGEKLNLIHAKGETDDCTIVWCEARKLLLPGDFWIWNVPNCGNPQKPDCVRRVHFVRRYPMEWSAALRMMANLGADLMVPGHGPPIIGAQRIWQAFSEVADFLDAIIEQCLAGINSGLTLNELLASVRIPDQKTRTYLRSTYDDPRFIIGNMWRMYAGAWDQDPAHLLPAENAKLAVAISEAAGGAKQLARNAQSLIESDVLVATQLVEYAGIAAPTDVEVHSIRAEIYRRRKEAERSLMAQSIFGDAERASLRVLGKL